MALVRHVDADLAVRDGQDHAYYALFNTLDMIKHVVVAYAHHQPVGCGAIKAYGPATMEVKRMFVAPEKRNRGIAGRILDELEHWAMELSCEKCVLETGRRQPEAIALYEKHGYTRIPNYGQYAEMENSVCFEKALRS